MSWAFVAPWALAASALIALPILAHRMRRPPTIPVPSGILLLLRRLPNQVRASRRLEDRALLAIRVLAVLAVALAAAGLDLKLQGVLPPVGGSGRVVVVLDRSASMGAVVQGQTLLEHARAAAAQAISALPEGARVAVVAADADAEVLTDGLVDPDVALAALDRVAVTRRATRLSAAFDVARELLADAPGEVAIWSDQAGPEAVGVAVERMERLLGDGHGVLPMPLPTGAQNVGVVSAVWSEGANGGELAVEVAAWGGSAREVSCAVVHPGGAEAVLFVDVIPGKRVVERIAVPVGTPGGLGSVRCVDADMPGDDLRPWAVPDAAATQVLVVDGDPGDTPTQSEVYFLERALAPHGGSRGDLAVSVVPPAGLATLDPAVHRVAWLANVGDPRPWATPLLAFVRGGGTVVIAGGDNVDVDAFNATFGTLLPSALRPAVALAAVGERGEPVARPVAELPWPLGLDPSAFSRARARTVLSLDPYAEGGDLATWLTYQGGRAALVERTTGDGRVIVWTSTVDLAWSDMALQGAFLPLVHGISRRAGGGPTVGAAVFDVEVGVPGSWRVPDATERLNWIGPDGVEEAASVSDGRVGRTMADAGGWRVVGADGADRLRILAAVAASESDLSVPLTIREVQARAAPERSTRHVDLSSAAWAAAVALALMASVVSGRARLT